MKKKAVLIAIVNGIASALILFFVIGCERPLGGTDETDGDQVGEVTDVNQGGGTDGDVTAEPNSNDIVDEVVTPDNGQSPASDNADSADSEAVDPAGEASQSESDETTSEDGEPADDGDLTLGPIGLGTTELKYPPEFGLNEIATIELVVAVNPDLTNAKLVNSNLASPANSLDGSEAEIVNRALGADAQIEYETASGSILIYPVMGARLQGIDFEVLPSDTQIQEFDFQVQRNLIWTWTVTAQEPGIKTLQLEIFLPVAKNDLIGVSRSRTLSSFTMNIDVQVTPSPTPMPTPTSTPTLTPTPVPPSPTPTPTPLIAKRVINNLTDEPAALLGTLLTFIVGVGGLFLTFLNYKRQQQPPASPVPAILNSRAQVTLHKILDNYFNEQELRNLCLDLGIDYEDLPFSGQTNKARELVALSARTRRLKELALAVKKYRPNLFKTSKEQ